MKVEIKESMPVQPEKECPWIGISIDRKDIVLFNAPYSGMPLISGYGHKSYSTSWAESNFTPFTGTVTLSND